MILAQTATYTVVLPSNVIALVRELGAVSWLVALNLAPGPNQLDRGSVGAESAGTVVVTKERRLRRLGPQIYLASDDGLLVRLDEDG